MDLTLNVRTDRIDDDTYMITEGSGRAATHSYLLSGKEKALLIDSGMGIADFDTITKQLTDLPVEVFCTHGHFDHVSGNRFFDVIYLNEKDDAVYKQGCDYRTRKNLLLSYFLSKGIHQDILQSEPAVSLLEQMSAVGCKPYIPISEDMILDIGDRPLLVLEIPGHTPGSTALVDLKHRHLFAGDMVCEAGVMMNLDHSAELPVFFQSIAHLKEKEELFDDIYGGHQRVPLCKDILDDFLALGEQIKEGSAAYELQEGTYFYHYGKANIQYSETNRIHLS